MWDQVSSATEEYVARIFPSLFWLAVLCVFVMEGEAIFALAGEVASRVEGEFDTDALAVAGVVTLIFFVFLSIVHLTKDGPYSTEYRTRLVVVGFFVWLLIIVPVLLVLHSRGIRLAVGSGLFFATAVSFVRFCCWGPPELDYSRVTTQSQPPQPQQRGRGPFGKHN
jgi:hypothetical protein